MDNKTIAKRIAETTAPPSVIDAVTALIDENERLRAAIDFMENNLVGYGTGCGIAHKEMILEDEYATQISAHGKDIFECIEDGKRIMRKLEKYYT